MKVKHTVWVVMCLLTAGAAQGQIDPAFQEMALFGINRDTGAMKRFDFPTNSLTSIGTVRSTTGSPMLGINAAGYIPGHSNIIAFWKDATGKSRMVYVNTQTAVGSVIGQHLGAGDVTGAVATTNGNADVAGSINLNPNSSTNNEFVMYTSDAKVILRDDLHQDATVQADGTMHLGGCYYIRVKPKGNGNQNGLIINGQALALDNGKQYTLVGEMSVRLYNDSMQGGKAMGHWWVDITAGKCNVHEDGNMIVGGATGMSPWAVFAVQNVQPDGGDTVDFGIDDDLVVPNEPYALQVKVLGAAISNGSYNFGVTTRIKVGGVSYEPFGDYNKGKSGNVNDDQNPRTHTFEQTFDAGTPISILGRSWAKYNNKSGNSDSHWYTYIEANGSDGNSQQIKVLRNGDPVPDIEGYLDQDGVEDFIKDYIDPATNKMKLGVNDAIFLFELGTTNMSSSAADFQDLVVLVSLANSPDDFNDGGSGASAPIARLIKVNHLTGGYSQLMGLQNQYDGLATLDGLTFHASKGGQLYRLDVVNQTETLVGNMPRDNMHGLECAGTTLMGFETDGERLYPIDVISGAALGSPAILGMTDLGTIVFMHCEKDPALKPVSYD